MTLVSYVEFAARIGVPHGTVKRWVLEGLPVERGLPAKHRPARIEVSAGEAWVAANRSTSVSFDRVSTIYLAQRQTDGAVKIGWTSDVERRLRELRKTTRAAVVLLASFPGDKPAELRLHERFAEHRLDGEWFHPAPQVVAFINAIGSVAA